MQNYDAIETLGLLFFSAMFIIFSIGWWISEHRPRYRNRRKSLRAPTPDDRSSIQTFRRMYP